MQVCTSADRACKALLQKGDRIRDANVHESLSRLQSLSSRKRGALLQSPSFNIISENLLQGGVWLLLWLCNQPFVNVHKIFSGENAGGLFQA